MITLATPPRYTVDEFIALPDHKFYELVDGRLVEVHVSNLSVLVGAELVTRLTNYCKPKKLGRVFGSDAYFRCFAELPRHARKPDVSFVSQNRLEEGWLADGYFTIAPDLAVEVVSPNDLVYELDEKIREYLKAEVKLVWIINPEQKTVTINRPDGSVTRLTETDLLDGELVIPGFSCLAAELFPTP